MSKLYTAKVIVTFDIVVTFRGTMHISLKRINYFMFCFLVITEFARARDARSENVIVTKQSTFLDMNVEYWTQRPVFGLPEVKITNVKLTEPKYEILYTMELTTYIEYYDCAIGEIESVSVMKQPTLDRNVTDIRAVGVAKPNSIRKCPEYYSPKKTIFILNSVGYFDGEKPLLATYRLIGSRSKIVVNADKSGKISALVLEDPTQSY